ncbi:MAG TPA: carbohydrate ABC transporter permease, partial [Verrucomicrobiae bacterium]
MNLPVQRKPRHERPPFAATLLLAAAGVAFFYPFAWMFCSAFKANREIFRPLQLFPQAFDAQYFSQLFSGQWIPFWQVFANSLAIAFVQAAGAVALASLAGYAFARHQFAGKRWLFILALVVIVIPQNALAVPLFTWLHSLGLSDRLLGVILPGTVSGLGILYFTQVFRQVPDELVDAARLAGASEFRVYLTLLPLVRSALISFGLIHFILAWHEHLIPLLVLSSAQKQTLPLALASLYGSSLRFPFAVLMAASTLAVLPTAVLFALLHRRFKSA